MSQLLHFSILLACIDSSSSSSSCNLIDRRILVLGLWDKPQTNQNINILKLSPIPIMAIKQNFITFLFTFLFLSCHLILITCENDHDSKCGMISFFFLLIYFSSLYSQTTHMHIDLNTLVLPLYFCFVTNLKINGLHQNAMHFDILQ